jgi:hypothetical protein
MLATAQQLLRQSFTVVILSMCVGLSPASADPGSARAKAPSLPDKISVQLVPMILNPEMVPSDPGASSNATLAGVDSNSNGLRDEVERWIAQNYPQCARYRAALSQVALSVQRRILAGEVTEESALQMASEESSATMCFAVESESCEAASLEKFIEFSVLLQNTPERGKAFLRLYKKLGKKLQEAPAEGCTIPSQQLPN